MAEENEFFRPIRDIEQRRVVSCGADDVLVDIVGRMREMSISCVVVVEGERPTAILTDRDLRNKVIAAGRDPAGLRVRDVMSAPVITIGEEDVLYEALYRMSRHGIHRLVVVDRKGALAGIVTVTDLLRLQAHSPHQLVLDIEKADSIDALRELHQRIQKLIVHLAGTGIAIRDTVKLIANLNDQVLIRLIDLLRRDRYPDLTADFTFVVMGSEGRSLPLRRPGQGLGRKLLYGVAVLALATPAVLLLRSYLQPAPAVASLDALPATDVAGPEAELALPVRVAAAGVQQSLPLMADAAATGLPSAPVTPAAAAATPPGEGAQLLLEFAGDSWSEIGGPQGRVVEKSLIPAGQQRRYRAEDVARVLLGNSTQVQASIDGRAIDLTAMGRSNVARFTVSSEGSVSPVVN